MQARTLSSRTASCSYASTRPRTARPGRSRQHLVSKALLKPAEGLAVTWSQTVDDVVVRVPLPDGVRGRDLKVEVHPKRLSLSHGGKALLEGSLVDAGEVNVDGCFWTLEGEPGSRHVALTLAKKSMGYGSWECLLTSEAVDDTITHRVFLELSQEGVGVLGKVAIGLHGNVVPKTVENFRALCTGEKGSTPDGVALSYVGVPLHRIIPGFMAQGGDITSKDGFGGCSIYGKEFEDENFKLKHGEAGVVAMANAGPATNNSQFYITYSPQPHLDGKHVVFGKVLAGMDLMRRVEALGSDGGAPTAAVTISACGELAGGEADVGKVREENRRLGLHKAQ